MNNPYKPIKYTTFIIKSWKTYEAKQLNILKESTMMLERRMQDPRDYTVFCPYKFDVVNRDGDETIYLIHLTDRQISMWRINKDSLSEADFASIKLN